MNGAFKIDRQARSWDHLAAILIFLPTQSEMLPSGFFRSLRATGIHSGRGRRREKLGHLPKTSFPPSTGGWVWISAVLRNLCLWYLLAYYAVWGERHSSLVMFSQTLMKIVIFRFTHQINIHWIFAMCHYYTIRRYKMINKAWLSELWAKGRDA